MARILLDQNKDQEAREHLDVASQVWEKADTAYIYAKEIQSLLNDLDI